MIATLSRVQLDVLSPATWISLTYHLNAPEDRETIIAHVEAFQARIRRKFPSFVYMRRIAWQTRGAVHWHYIAWTAAGTRHWNSPRVLRWIARIWHQIADPDSEYHRDYGAKVVAVEAYRQIMHYVSQYCAKTDPHENPNYAGRRWSCSYHLPTSPLVTADVPARAIIRLARAARLLGRLRGASMRWQYQARRRGYEIVLLLRPGEADRLYALAGLPPVESDPPPDG